VANPKWGGHVPLILMDAHREYSLYIQDENEKKNYWKQPDVWPDMKAAFDRFFALNPDATGWHHDYAWYAYQCGQWDEFNRQIRQFSYGTNYAYFGGKDAFDLMVQTAAKNSSAKKN